jgi:hypothetical protein
MFAIMKSYVPAPPPGAQPPPLWGSEAHVRALFGDRVTDLVARRQTVTVDRFENASAFRDYFKANYGPTVAAYQGIAADPARVSALDRELAGLAQRHLVGEDKAVMEWEYLLLTARKRG